MVIFHQLWDVAVEIKTLGYQCLPMQSGRLFELEDREFSSLPQPVLIEKYFPVEKVSFFAERKKREAKNF